MRISSNEQINRAQSTAANAGKVEQADRLQRHYFLLSDAISDTELVDLQQLGEMRGRRESKRFYRKGITLQQQLSACETTIPPPPIVFRP